MFDRSRLCVLICVSFGLFGLSSCGSSLVGNSLLQISPSSAVLLPGQTLQFGVTGSASNARYLWQVNGVVGGTASSGGISLSGLYAAPAGAAGQTVQVGIQGQPAQVSVSVFNPSQPVPGMVATTQNPLVAAYSMTIPAGASIYVQFGSDTSYGLSTSSVAGPATGGTATILVAGMHATATYHMQAVIELPDGSVAKDSDHTFTTGAIPAANLPAITAQLSGNGAPSPGVELLSLTPSASQTALCAVATDLSGDIIWYYPLPEGAYPFPIKLLPNGHMLLLTAGTLDDVREIDLAGNIIHQVTFDAINQSLAKLVPWGIAEFSHDVQVLPNGHWIILANLAEPVSNVPGVPDGTEVTGNALIDWDPDRGAVWTWSTFDHLDLTRAPYGISDWTHGNAVIYSPDDGDLIFSMRNQNWVVKINYQDGQGDGKIVWRFGPGGDFTLPNQDAPVDWNYGQHYPTIQSPNSSGIFSLMVFDNGNNRLMDSNNDVCGSAGVSPCYSSVPIYQLNEYTMTASVLWQENLLNAYSTCCGDALVLPSGNVEFDVAFDQNNPNVSYIEEVTQTQSPELIWRMNIQGQVAYRGFRIPSLYPGQTWPASLTQNARPTTLQTPSR